MDIPKQARSYSLEVIGSSDDLKKKIDYERIVSDGSTIVTNDLQLMAYLNSSIRRSIYGNEINKVHIGDKIVSYRDIFGENFIVPKGTVLMVNEIVRSDDDHIEAVVTNPTYSKNIDPVISARCATCHYDSKEFPNLTTYEEVVDATADGELLCRINGTCGAVMPESGKLPQATINMIQLWADNEFPN